jgi:hypothetical protein
MSREGCTDSLLARWPLPTENTRHVIATHCFGDVITPALKCVYRALSRHCVDQNRSNIMETYFHICGTNFREHFDILMYIEGQ